MSIDNRKKSITHFRCNLFTISQKRKDECFFLAIIAIIVVCVCVCCSLKRKDTNSFDDYEKMENETDFVPFPKEDENETNKEQDKASDKSETSDTGNNQILGDVGSENANKDNTTDSSETTGNKKPDSDETIDDNEQEKDDNSIELPFVPFD